MFADRIAFAVRDSESVKAQVSRGRVFVCEVPYETACKAISEAETARSGANKTGAEASGQKQSLFDVLPR